MRDDELRADGPPDKFDNTMITNYTACPRKAYWFLRGLDYLNNPPYFTYGRAWGHMLNHWHTQAGIDTMQDRFKQGLAIGLKIWEAEAPVVKEKSNDTWAGLQDTFFKYCEAYGKTESWTQIGSELGFAFPIPGTSLYYAGAIDAYIEWEPYGVLLREDKTTGAYLTEQYYRYWKHASQVTGYFWALGQVLGEEPFGVLMNLASKRPRKEPDLRFQRDLIKKSDWQVAEFMKHTTILCDRFRREWDTWEWPKFGERLLYECSGGPGKSPCLYRNLCLQEQEPWVLEENYDFSQEFQWRVHKWEPWKREGDDKEEGDG